MIRTLRIIGTILLLGGVAHFAGVGFHLATRRMSDATPRHLAYLAMIGLVHLAAGSLDLATARGLARGESIARPVGWVSCGLVIAWAVAMVPVLLHAAAIFQVMPAIYLAVHVALVVALFR